MPLTFQTRLETIPAWQDGYLHPRAAEVAHGSRRLPAGRRAWQANLAGAALCA
ncbi:MAG: hypothetical protein ACK4Y5_02460 [Acetobacteraceae bacterium]